MESTYKNLDWVTEWTYINWTTWDTSDSQISKIIFSTNSSDEFWVKIQNEINTLSEPIKNELSKQFNIKF